MITLNPYLTFPGTAAQAIKLYEEVFQTKVDFIQYFAAMPAQEGMAPLSAEDKNRVMHASITLGNNILMLCDNTSDKDENTVAKRISISIHPETKQEADRMFALLCASGTVEMPLADQFWGDYFGICLDAFGISWMINVAQDS